MDEQNVYLTDDERAHFQKWESLFASEGWELFTKELQTELDDLPNRGFADAKNWEEVLAGRAAEKKLREILHYPNEIELRKQHLLLERKWEAEEAAEANRPDV